MGVPRLVACESSKVRIRPAEEVLERAFDAGSVLAAVGHGAGVAVRVAGARFVDGLAAGGGLAGVGGAWVAVVALEGRAWDDRWSDRSGSRRGALAPCLEHRAPSGARGRTP